MRPPDLQESHPWIQGAPIEAVVGQARNWSNGGEHSCSPRVRSQLIDKDTTIGVASRIHTRSIDPGVFFQVLHDCKCKGNVVFAMAPTAPVLPVAIARAIAAGFAGRIALPAAVLYCGRPADRAVHPAVFLASATTTIPGLPPVRRQPARSQRVRVALTVDDNGRPCPTLPELVGGSHFQRVAQPAVEGEDQRPARCWRIARWILGMEDTLHASHLDRLLLHGREQVAGMDDR
eukprot:CAMPEP_0179103638 /NCGR_PEP_ID=MMETSP0796-20121207/48032_1 /TAXON_ID=73915 /ORGANISM="Pyrodinium bahamense, Strain pbaha01" /LENGTH=232 /DNA_ID=CAMNT_0020801553 /DNA_START=533 /DNA_END=1231 /DNA_ORIENTATION=+